jgi:hypothetical protein
VRETVEHGLELLSPAA